MPSIFSPSFSGGVFPANGPGHHARAAAVNWFGVFQCLFRPLLQVFFHRRLVISGRFPLHKGDRARGTGGQAVAQSVAVIVPHQPGLAVHHGDGPFLTGGRTRAAAVAFFLINMDNFANHILPSQKFGRFGARPLRPRKADSSGALSPLDFARSVYYNSAGLSVEFSTKGKSPCEKFYRCFVPHPCLRG